MTDGKPRKIALALKRAGDVALRAELNDRAELLIELAERSRAAREAHIKSHEASGIEAARIGLYSQLMVAGLAFF